MRGGALVLEVAIFAVKKNPTPLTSAFADCHDSLQASRQERGSCSLRSVFSEPKHFHLCNKIAEAVRRQLQAAVQDTRKTLRSTKWWMASVTDTPPVIGSVSLATAGLGCVKWSPLRRALARPRL